MMLTIRREQLEMFEKADSPEFERQMIRHVQEAFPKHCRFLDEQAIREVVRYGVGHASAQGFIKRGPVALCIDLSLLLGRDFDSDPQLPWAREIILDSVYDDELQRAQRLHAVAMDYLEAVSGPDNEFIDAAQRRVLHEQVQVEIESPAELVTEICTRLQRLWPEKYRQLREDAGRSLIQLGVEKASSYGMKSDAGTLLMVGMMYLLGSGFDHDPMFAWLGPDLLDSGLHPPEVKIARVHTAALGYLRQWCA
jgi:hypothetical protein